jgi:hypothetical protein
MKEVVGELVAIVGGKASAAFEKHSHEANAGKSFKKAQSLSKSDELLHQIASGTRQASTKTSAATSGKVSGRNAIPLDDDNKDMKDFNN